jgi:2-C-methyl-D-erythritol 4-phosphate cytidylyltransferase
LAVEGGKTRQESVRRGLALVKTQRVLVHVAAVTARTLEQVSAVDADCVTTTTPVETNLVRGDEIAEVAVPRAGLKIINSPQCFRTEVLRECHDRAADQGLAFASETALMLHYKRQVRLVSGPARNFKITTALDFLLAEAILASDCEPAK